MEGGGSEGELLHRVGWELQLIFSMAQWSTYAVLTGHSQSISALAALELPAEGEEKDYVVLTGSSDGCIQCWRISAGGSGAFATFCSLSPPLMNLPSQSSFRSST